MAPFVQAIQNYKQRLTEEHGGDPMQFVRKQGARFFIFEYLILCSFFSNMVSSESSEMIMTLMTVKVFGKLLINERSICFLECLFTLMTANEWFMFCNY